jgi:hypothetical protein
MKSISTGRGGMRANWLLLSSFILAFYGCFGGQIREGCATDDDVPPEVKKDLVAAAGTFYDRIRRGEWETIFETASTVIREEQSPQQFLAPLAQVAQAAGIAESMTVDQVSVVRFGQRYLPRTYVECTIEGEEFPLVLIMTDYPVQASLVQKGKVGREEFYFSTLWHQEGDEWKIAGFFSKPATWVGKGWKEYSDQAAEQRLAKNVRNAALLYNLAMDLLVPGAWIQPPELALLQRRQSRLTVANLPINIIDLWPDPPDTFRVVRISYALLPGHLGLLIRYQAEGSVADPVAQEDYASRLLRFVRLNFPEYQEAFSVYSLLAVDPEDPQRSWNQMYPMEADE